MNNTQTDLISHYLYNSCISCDISKNKADKFRFTVSSYNYKTNFYINDYNKSLFASFTENLRTF